MYLMTLKSLAIIALQVPLIIASPALIAPTVTIKHPPATIIGLTPAATAPNTEQFSGIRFARPPTGPLRLKPPQPLTRAQGVIHATQNGNICPQFVFTETSFEQSIPTASLALLLDSPLFQKAAGESEDCLNLNVYRPKGTKAGDNLPVIFWMFGGAFEVGWASLYDGAYWTEPSIALGQPVIVVTVNYRVGGFGWLAGKEILKDGSANLGHLDQRLGMQWVADNIAAFGGDPEKVTIWGESSGAISVFNHMVAYDGNNTYKGKPLFRGGMMNSGSTITTDPVDCPRAQKVYDTVVHAAGCSGAADTLACLRTVDYETFLRAANSPPGLLSYQSVALSYLPRPDGTFLTASPDVLSREGKIAKVPFILGDQEDEGTLFSLFQNNITTQNQLVDYLLNVLLSHATRPQIEEFVGFYKDTSTDGSPFRTGLSNNWYPQYKRLAAILGDVVFTLSRRATLTVAESSFGGVPFWSYLSSYYYGTAILGTFHGSDIFQVFYGVESNYASSAFHEYYINFVNTLNPNRKGSKFPTWPTWAESKQLLNMYPNNSTFIPDDFRQDAYNYLVANLGSFYV